MNSLLLSVLASMALAQGRSDLDILQTARLNEAAYGNHEEAGRDYLELVSRLAADDPLRAEALFRLASTRYAQGDLEGAREPLIKANRTGRCGTACQLLRDEIDLELASVRMIPQRWNFSSTDHGLFHPWEFGEKGGIRVQSRDDAANPALIWHTIVDVNKGDRLVVGFERPKPAPSRVRFKIQAEDRNASIKVVLIDDMGRSYAPEGPIRVVAERPTLVDIDLGGLVPAVASDPPLDPSTLHRLHIDDVSARNGTQSGQHALYLDDFEIL